MMIAPDIPSLMCATRGRAAVVNKSARTLRHPTLDPRDRLVVGARGVIHSALIVARDTSRVAACRSMSKILVTCIDSEHTFVL
jgi:hypothetical protein